jgi:hypothetical protein
MVSRITALLLCAAAVAHAQIDFTPRTRPTQFEGVAVNEPAFRNGEGWVQYVPPGGWEMQGEGRTLTLKPRDKTFAAASIESRALPANKTLDEDLVLRLKAEIQHSLPKEAEQVTWEAVEANPVLLNRHETRRVTVSYHAFAQQFTVTMIVCNFADQQIRFRLETRADDFEKLYDAFRRSLYTWQGLP